MNEDEDKDLRSKCERCMEDGLEPHEYCKYYGEPDGCNSPTYGQYPPDKNTPNMWKIIEVLEKFVDWYNEERDDLDEIAEEADKALSDLHGGKLPNCACLAEMTLEKAIDYLDSCSNWTLNGQNSAQLSSWLRELVVLKEKTKTCHQNEMCGIILSGGAGTRLRPMTTAVSKQLLPIYDKPMIYFPLSILMLAGIRDILLISDEYSIPMYKKLFGDGEQFGIKMSYKVQQTPNGLAQAFVLGKEFIGNRNVCLVLGDNIFHGAGLTKILFDSVCSGEPTVFAYRVSNPSAYGVVEFDKSGDIISIEEKPKNPKSDYAIPGIYFFPNDVVGIAENIKPSARGEYEITDVINKYLSQGRLKVKVMQRGIAWLDSGTPQSLNDASNFVRTIEERTGLKIADLREIAKSNGWIKECNEQQKA